MAKEKSDMEIVEQIMWEIGGVKRKTDKKKTKKSRRNKRMIETGIDIFADDDQHKI